jgi:starch synthase
LTNEKRKGLRILFCACEAAPFVKTGGLADVAGSLPAALGELGHEIRVVMPKFRGIKKKRHEVSSKVSYEFIENDAYFDRPAPYGDEKGDYPDNLERFSFYSRSALDWAKAAGFKPDIVHSHEWQTGLVPIDLKTLRARDSFFSGVKTLFTIHNLAYQGLFPLDDFRALGLPDEVLTSRGIEYWGRGSLMKGALVFSDMLSTVSPTYAKEIRTPQHGCGLDAILKKRSGDLIGILNGIDAAAWNPETDTRLKERYSWRNPGGKLANKRELQAIYGLSQDDQAPLFGLVSRLVEQKGLDIVMKAFDRLMALGVQIALLGTGEEKYHRFFEKMNEKYSGRFAARLKFDAVLAEKVYAGSDFFLMPSRFEPCGLGQMISFRFGTLPVVHKTGGLADTVSDCSRNPLGGNGFVFSPFKEEPFLEAVKRAAKTFTNAKKMHALSRRVMKLDFSWKKSAERYDALYRRLAKSSSKAWSA